jgi:hypothetical protein
MCQGNRKRQGFIWKADYLFRILLSFILREASNQSLPRLLCAKEIVSATALEGNQTAYLELFSEIVSAKALLRKPTAYLNYLLFHPTGALKAEFSISVPHVICQENCGRQD